VTNRMKSRSRNQDSVDKDERKQQEHDAEKYEDYRESTSSIPAQFRVGTTTAASFIVGQSWPTGRGFCVR